MMMAMEELMATATVVAIEGLTAMEGSKATATAKKSRVWKGAMAMATEMEG